MAKYVINDPEWESSYKKSFKVRDYSEQELKIIEQELPIDCHPSQRIVKLIKIGQINNQRYEDAKYTHPEMAEHMVKMQLANSNFISSVITTYLQEHGVIFDDTGVIDNNTLPAKQIPVVIDAEFVNRPA